MLKEKLESIFVYFESLENKFNKLKNVRRMYDEEQIINKAIINKIIEIELNIQDLVCLLVV